MRIFLILILCLSGWLCHAQNIFSESQFDNSKPFAPYEISNMIGLDDQEFILLLEQGKGKFKLVRYDEYFIDRWSKELDYNREGSFPKLLQLGDDIGIFRFWTLKSTAFAEIRIYNKNSGELISEKKEVIRESAANAKEIKIKFSPDLGSFLIYNFHSEDREFELFEVFSSGTLSRIKSYQLESSVCEGKTKGVYLHNNSDLFLVFGDAGTFTIDAYFFATNVSHPVKLSASMTFSRPADNFPDLFINKQSESAYFVTTVANVERDLVGINVSSFNVVLKSVLFSNSYNVDQEFTNETYQNGIITSKEQKKKLQKTPGQLTNFYLQETILDEDGHLTCLFERQELISTYHDPAAALNMSLKWEEPDDQVFSSEDILMINFNSTGEMSWKNVIQKIQKEKGMGLGMSYLSELMHDELRIIVQDDSKGNSFYYFSINTANGEIISKQGFIDKKLTYNKNYSGWVDQHTLLICGYPPGSNNRTFYLMEF